MMVAAKKNIGALSACQGWGKPIGQADWQVVAFPSFIVMKNWWKSLRAKRNALFAPW